MADTPASSPAFDATEIDALLAKALADHKLPGAVVAVGRSDDVLFTRAYGMRALLPAPEPMTVDTIFDLASLTKPVATASSLMLLVEDGKLKLRDKVSHHLAETDRPASRAITLRQLLTHASGLPHVNPLRDYATDARSKLLAITPSATRDHFLYSDIGYLWLGEVVQRIAGRSLQDFTSERIFKPLGMADTRYQPPAAWRARIAPTELTDQRGAPQTLIRGVVHDPRAYRLGGIAGNAGLFSTAADLSRFARMLLSGGTLDGKRVLSAESVAEMTRAVQVGTAVRTLGWDMRSAYSRLRGQALSDRAFGHGGHTGTSLWIDPSQDLFVLLLSHRVHPDGKGNVIGLGGELADAAVRALRKHDPCVAAARVLPGIDVLREQGFLALAGKRVGLVTHLAARSSSGETTLDLVQDATNLVAIFSPEHGLSGTHEGVVRKQQAPVQRTYSLFGPNRQPTAEMLEGIDVLVVDLVDVGTRFFTYMSTLHEVLLAASRYHVPVLVLDRPNPLGGVAVEGPVLDAGVHTFVNHYPLPIRHGLTAGELAALINAEEQLGVALTVIEASGWRRDMLHGATSLRWTRPSPNLRTAEAALLYPAIGLLESTNLSVGRGTSTPFQHFGAPFIDAKALLRELKAEDFPSVRMHATTFVPSTGPHAGQRCAGLALSVVDPHALRPVSIGMSIARALFKLYPTQWQADRLIKLLGHKKSLDALLTGSETRMIEALWQDDLARFEERRKPFLRYPTCKRR